MKKWFVRVLLSGLAALPTSAYGQNMGNSNPQAQRYNAAFPYSTQPQNQPGTTQDPAPSVPPMALIASAPQGPAAAPVPAAIPAVPIPTSPPASLVPLVLPETTNTPSEAKVKPSSKPPIVPEAGTSVLSAVAPVTNSVKEAPLGYATEEQVASPFAVAQPVAKAPVTKEAPIGYAAEEKVSSLFAVAQPVAKAPVTKAAKEAPIGYAAEEKLSSPFAVATPDTSVLSEGFFCPKKECHVAFFFDYLYWSVHGGDVPYAQAFDGVDPNLSVPRGAVGTVSPTFASGFRIGGAVSVGEGQWIVATFTDFYTSRSSYINAGDGLVLHNFLTFPNTANAAVDSLTASADYRIQLRTADLDYKCAIICNDHMLLNWTAGVRYASLTQDLTNNFQLTGTSTVSSNINFDGFGPRFGLEAKYGFSNCGLFGYANGLVDLLMGQFRGSYEETNNFTGVVGSTSITSNRVVPILEFELGVGWESANGHVRVSAGYYVGSWFNTMTTTGLSSSIGNVNFTTNGNNFRDNLTFDGFVGRVEFRF